MAIYRIYLIDGGGRVQLGESFNGRDDAEALARFQALDRGGYAAELWQGGRLVCKLPGDTG